MTSCLRIYLVLFLGFGRTSISMCKLLEVTGGKGGLSKLT